MLVRIRNLVLSVQKNRLFRSYVNFFLRVYTTTLQTKLYLVHFSVIMVMHCSPKFLHGYAKTKNWWHHDIVNKYQSKKNCVYFRNTNRKHISNIIEWTVKFNLFLHVWSLCIIWSLIYIWEITPFCPNSPCIYLCLEFIVFFLLSKCLCVDILCVFISIWLINWGHDLSWIEMN